MPATPVATGIFAGQMPYLGYRTEGVTLCHRNMAVDLRLCPQSGQVSRSSTVTDNALVVDLRCGQIPATVTGMTPTRKSPKQANGEAKPYYKPSKQRWIGPYTVDGVRHEITGTDEATVRARWADKQLEIAVAARTGVAVVDDRLTVGRLFDSWIAGDCPSFGKRNDPTVAGIATATRLLNDHLRPALGNVAIRDLKPSMVTALFKRMAAERTVRAPNGYADTTLVRLRGILDRVLQYAEAEGTAMPPAARTAARNARIPNDAHGVTVERRSLSGPKSPRCLRCSPVTCTSRQSRLWPTPDFAPPN